MVLVVEMEEIKKKIQKNLFDVLSPLSSFQYSLLPMCLSELAANN
mgnify:CR=1 FL=1